jgi:hypothetical protein
MYYVGGGSYFNFSHIALVSGWTLDVCEDVRRAAWSLAVVSLAVNYRV